MNVCGVVQCIETVHRICAVARYYGISSKADHGDIFIVHDQKSSYRTPLHLMLFNEALSERETLHLDTAMCKAMCLIRAIKKNYTVME